MSRDRGGLGWIVLLVCISAGTVGLSPAPSPAGTAAPGAITGAITGPDGAALEMASVSAYPVTCDSGCDPYSAVSNADGTYELAGLPPGSYQLMFQVGTGYLAEFYDNVTEQDNATAVVVRSGETVAGRDAQLEHGGRLTGTVTGRGGQRLKGITVTAYHRERGRWRYVREVATSRDGGYAVEGLLSGAYRLRFSDDAEPGYLTQYRGGIVLGPDATAADLDARLAWPRTLRPVRAPRVIGSARAGSTVRLFPGTWKPSKITVTVLGWYADDVYHYLGHRGRSLSLVGGTLAKARGHYVVVRFWVDAPGYARVDRTLIAPGGKVG